MKQTRRNGKKRSASKKKRKTNGNLMTNLMEESTKVSTEESKEELIVLFDEAHEGELVESIDESILGEEISLPVSDDVSFFCYS